MGAVSGTQGTWRHELKSRLGFTQVKQDLQSEFTVYS